MMDQNHPNLVEEHAIDCVALDSDCEIKRLNNHAHHLERSSVGVFIDVQ